MIPNLASSFFLLSTRRCAPFASRQIAVGPGFPGPHRTVRETLASYGSSRPTRLPIQPAARPLFRERGPPALRLPRSFHRPSRPLRSSSITEPSSLLRADPPPWSALVLNRSRVLRLRVSLSIAPTGSHVPHLGLDHILAAYMPDADRAVNRHLPISSRSKGETPVLTSSMVFRHFFDGSLAFDSMAHT